MSMYMYIFNIYIFNIYTIFDLITAPALITAPPDFLLYFHLSLPT